MRYDASDKIDPSAWLQRDIPFAKRAQDVLQESSGQDGDRRGITKVYERNFIYLFPLITLTSLRARFCISPLIGSIDPH